MDIHTYIYICMHIYNTTMFARLESQGPSHTTNKFVWEQSCPTINQSVESSCDSQVHNIAHSWWDVL